jgi:hypothetical protein
VSEQASRAGWAVMAGVGVAVIAAVVAVLIASDGPDAYSVGRRSVSQSAFNDELKVLAEHPTFSAAVFGIKPQTTGGAVDKRLAAGWMTFRIEAALAHQAVAARGGRVTDADREAVADIASDPARFRRYVRLLPQGFREGFVRDSAAFVALARMSGFTLRDEGGRFKVAQAICRRAKRTEVEVDPRYGTWIPRVQQVLAPGQTVAGQSAC